MKNLIKVGAYFLTMFSVAYAIAEEKVLIITSAYNRADFIEIQHRTFSKFLTDAYEFVVFNDAKDPKHYRDIREMCDKYEISCIDIPQEIHDQPYLFRLPGESYNHPAVRNCNVVQYALNTVGFSHRGPIAIFDSDLFLVKECSFYDLLAGVDIIGHLQEKEKDGVKVQYLWIGLVLLNTKNLTNLSSLNFNCGRVNNVPVDAGGHSHDYLQLEKPNVHFCSAWTGGDCRCESCTELTNCPHIESIFARAKLSEAQIRYCIKAKYPGTFFYDGLFLHYGCGTNWCYSSDEVISNKTKALYDFIDEILAE